MVFLYFLFLLIFLIYTSKIKIETINFKFSSMLKKHVNNDYKIIIKLMIFGIVPCIKLTINKKLLEKIKIKEKIHKIETEVINNTNKIDTKIINEIKKIPIDIKKFYLKLELGTESASITSILVPAISTIISIWLRKKIKNFEDQIFIIKPVYYNQNQLELLFSGIFEFKTSHIITMILRINKKEGVGKYERTSNRRAYGYSYE